MTADTDGEDFLVYFAQVHQSFRQVELEALAELHSLPLKWKSYSDTSPFAIINLPSASAATSLVSRSILTKCVYALWGHSDSYTSLHEQLKTSTTGKPISTQTFKFTIESYMARRTMPSQRALIESFSYLPLRGRIDLKNPDLHFSILEEFAPSQHTLGDDLEPKQVYLGRWLSHGSRHLIDIYDLKKRNYIGTTSMDAELSLITANLSLCAPGKLIYDPFVGTGSFIVTCSEFGGVTLGSDIDGRQLRGKKGRNVASNFKQYKTTHRYLDGFVSDLTNTPLRPHHTHFLDAVVCDPPYGVREGLKVLGSRDPTKPKEVVMLEGKPMHLEPDYIPPKRPYSFLAMLDDILQFSADYLVEGGRLCFWMPTANEDLDEFDIPSHPELQLVAVSTQTFNKWSRRLLTYARKPLSASSSNPIKAQDPVEKKKATADQLNDFRRKYFKGFKQAATSTVRVPETD